MLYDARKTLKKSLLKKNLFKTQFSKNQIAIKHNTFLMYIAIIVSVADQKKEVKLYIRQHSSILALHYRYCIQHGKRLFHIS